VRVEARVEGLAGFGAAGLAVGEVSGERIPYVRGLRFSRHEELKGFLAAAGSSGGMGLVIIEGVSPDAGRFSEGDLVGLERVSIGDSEVRWALEDLSCGEPEAALIGCPHASAELVEDLARVVVERGVRAYKPVWVFTSRRVYEELSGRGVIEALTSRGVEVFAGICGVISPLSSLGYRCIATPSAKAAFYLPRLAGARYVYMDIPEIVGAFFR